MGERPAMAELKSRQWSCETLSRGISYLNHQQASVKEENQSIDEQIQAAQELREKLREQVRQAEIQEAELAKEKEKQDQIAPEVANDTNEDQPDASPVKENEIPATQEDGSQQFEEEYPDNQQGLWGSRDFESPEKSPQHSPTETVPGTDSQSAQMDCVSTPVRSQRLPPVASPPVTKPYMRNRDTREALTPTEPEMSPVKTDDYIYPLLVEESPAGKQVDEFFAHMASEPATASTPVGAGEPSSASASARPKEPSSRPSKPEQNDKALPAAEERSVKLVGGKTHRVISDNGAEQAIRRLCKPNAKGHKKVASEIAKQFFNGGQGRKELIKLFIESGGNHDMFRRQAELSIQRKQKRKECQGGGFYTEEALKTELKLPAKRIAAIKAYCSHPKRAKTHIRKDKYEKNVNKYLYETSDTLEYNKEEEETVTHTLEFDVSGPSSAAFPTMREGLVEARETRSRRPKAIKDKEPTDDDDDDDDSAADVMDEQTSDTNEDGNSDDQMSTSRASKRKGGSASTVSKRRREDNAPEIPEDVFDVDEILNQILKTNAKMNSLIPRLTELGGDEAAKEIKQLEARKASLLSLHDGIAGLKAEYDADQTMSPEKGKELKEKLCSKAAMDHKKLTRTLLKKNASTPGGRGGPDVEPKAKAKAKAKSDTRPGAKKGPKSKK